MDHTNPTPYRRDFPEEPAAPTEVIRLRTEDYGVGRVTMKLSPKGIDIRALGQLSFGHAWGEVKEVIFFPASAYGREWQRSQTDVTTGLAFLNGFLAARLIFPHNIYRGGPFVRVTTGRGIWLYGCDKPEEFRRGLALYRTDLLAAWDELTPKPEELNGPSSSASIAEWTEPLVRGWGWVLWIVVAAIGQWRAVEAFLKGSLGGILRGAAITMLVIGASVLLARMKRTLSVSREGLKIRRFPLPGFFVSWGDVLDVSLCDGHEDGLLAKPAPHTGGALTATRGLHLTTRTGEEHIRCPDPWAAYETIQTVRAAADQRDEKNDRTLDPAAVESEVLSERSWGARPTFDGLTGPIPVLVVVALFIVLFLGALLGGKGWGALMLPILAVAFQLMRFKAFWPSTALIAADEGVLVQTAEGGEPHMIRWSSLTVARRVGRTTQDAWLTLLAIVLTKYPAGSDVGGPLVEVGSRWFTWRISCSEPDAFLDAVYARRPDLKPELTPPPAS
jgi:hypothetical protein